MKLNIRKISLWVISIGLGLILTLAAHDKIMNPADFARAIRAYGLIPGLLSPIPAILLPWLELVCGVSLIFGIFRLAALHIAMFLFGLFAMVVGYALLMGLTIDCGCGVALAGSTVSLSKLLLNLLFLFLAITAGRLMRYENR